MKEQERESKNSKTFVLLEEASEPGHGFITFRDNEPSKREEV